MEDGEERLCASCWTTLRRVEKNDYTYKIMEQRFHDAGIVDGFYPLYYFEKNGVFQTLAHNLKYQEIRSFGVALGKNLGAYLKEIQTEFDCIIPVPLNLKKLRDRGYNQAERIAYGVSSVTAVPVKEKIVERIRYTQTQTKLNAEERKLNVDSAFAVRNTDAVQGKAILIVDDVITTGATIQEIAGVLKTSGAAKTYIASAGLAKLGDDV
ncbi:MAG: ComF family protein [Bacteroidetes bacterium]|nr:ComF family protein [Bacteroidota bacterium]